MIQLTQRQKAIVDFMPRCNCVADVGCDHGKLGAYLLLNGLAKKVIACDISDNSLQKARDLAIELDISDKMETRCGDGMAVLTENEAECVVIAGMGGNTICDILKQSQVFPETVIVQPMNAIEALKQSLSESGYYIKDDVIVREKRYYYSVFLLKRGQKLLKNNEIFLPVNSLARKDENCKLYLEKRLDTYLKALNNAKESASIKEKVELLQEALSCYN